MEMVFERGSNSGNRRGYKTEKNNSTRKFVAKVLIGVQLIIASVLNAKLMDLDVLPAKFDILLIAVIVLLNIILWFSTRKKSINILMSMTSGFLTAVFIIGTVAIFKLDTTLQSVISDTAYEIVEMSAVVPANSDISTLAGVQGKTIGIVEDAEHQEEIESQISAEANFTPKYEKYDDVIKLSEALLEKKEEVIIINPSHVEMMKEIEGYADIESKVKVIHTFKIKIKKEVEQKKENVNKDVFTVYLSGSDSRTGINSTSRSDVNILAIVNTKTRKVQLINTPRDYYVEIAGTGGKKDKLTHAGIQGVEASMETLEKLYDCEIDYYFKINFSGFIKIIDYLGGIDVYNEKSFTAITGDYFKQGNIHLNGTRALVFTRERHAFVNGDEQRGKNQMAVIKAVTDKMTSKEVLTKFDSIMNSMSGCFQTDIPSEKLYGIVKTQLKDNKAWEISTLSTTGTGLLTPTYMVSTPVWVQVPVDEDVAKAKQVIKDAYKTE